MHTVVLVLHLLVAIALIGFVLMQRSEGGALGIGGGGGSLISGRGAADVMVRITGGLALVFFVTSITLTMLAGGQRVHRSVVEEETDRPAWYQNLIPKDLFGQKDSAVVSPPAQPAPAPVAAAPAAPSADSQVIPGPDESMPRAGPIDVAPLAPAPAAAPAAQPKVAVVNPPKPAAAAPAQPAAQPAAKPPVRATKPASVKPAESAEPAGPPARIGPDE
jgi:preprotein translocase subunit SecG